MYKRQVYKDGQNVHNSVIQESIRKSLENIISTPPTMTEDVMITQILNCGVDLTPVIEYIENKEIHNILNVTFKDVLLPVWCIIQDHQDKETLLSILSQEMKDAECKCFTGRISRLVSTLDGFTDKVRIEVSPVEQISNVITRHISLNSSIEVVEKELIEYGYNKDEIKEWLDHYI